LHTSLVRFHFGRSTTGEGGWEEGEDDGAFAHEVGKMNGAAVGGRQGEIWSLIAYF